MGFFSTKEERARKMKEWQDAQLQEFLAKYNLDELSNPNDLELVKKVYNEMKGSGLMKFGINLTFNAEETCKISHLSALMHQNWMMINQLSRISNSLEKLVELQEREVE